MNTGEVYRDKRGRFVRKWNILQGPHFPSDPLHPINVERGAQPGREVAQGDGGGGLPGLILP